MKRGFIEKAAVLALLGLILFLSFYARSEGNVPDKMLSYDPIFQYRFTRYVVDFGELPVWDELGYYTGRAISTSTPTLIFYLTALIHSFTKNLGWSLTTTATFASAWYGALITIPAFLLAREFSNKWGGLLSAALAGSAPQILTRTFGASFDTDQMAVFFILLTLWTGVYLLKKRNVFSVTLSATCFILFATAWQTFWYTFFFIMAAAVVYLFVNHMSLLKHRTPEAVKSAVVEAKKLAFVILAVFLLVTSATFALGLEPINYFFAVIGFAQEAEKQIVNISIAELQLVNMGDISTWMLATGRFIIGDQLIDNSFFLILVLLMFYGLVRTYKADKITFSYLLTVILISFYTITRGIRFTEFSSGLLITVAAAGFGYLLADVKGKDVFVRGSVIGLALFLGVFSMSYGIYLGQHLGPDSNQNWDNAWTFLRTKTPELSLVGTWWDPGHMITGTAERRVIADGAHCADQCLYGINDRITSLGKIMATDDENVSLELIKKYRGTSPAAYWIASDDLVSKYQWLQYFGMGCDSRNNAKCQLYSPVNLESVKYDQNSRPIVKVYGPIIVLDVGSSPLAIYTQGRNAAFIDEILYYDGDLVRTSSLGENTTEINQGLEPLVKQLGYRLSNQTVPITAWIAKDSRMIVIIPPTLRNTVFTRMFFLEGQGLENFRQVFRNEQVKIYEIKF